MSEILRECPFCGEFPEYFKEKYKLERFNHFLRCSSCGLEMFDITKKGLIDNWNTRHQSKHETVEQWEARTGEIYPDDAPVWEFLKEHHEWALILYGASKILRHKIGGIIVANHHGKPEVTP